MERETSQHEARHASRAGSTYKGFLNDVRSLASDWDEPMAEKATVSVLCAISRRIRGEESRQLHAELPSRLQDLVRSCELHDREKPEKFGREDLFRTVAEDLGKSPDEVEPIVRTVMTALRAHVSEGEAEDVADQLPSDLKMLWLRPS
jgi:uncharacterized protein (DUF2267 family)